MKEKTLEVEDKIKEMDILKKNVKVCKMQELEVISSYQLIGWKEGVFWRDPQNEAHAVTSLRSNTKLESQIGESQKFGTLIRHPSNLDGEDGKQASPIARLYTRLRTAH